MAGLVAIGRGTSQPSGEPALQEGFRVWSGREALRGIEGRRGWGWRVGGAGAGGEGGEAGGEGAQALLGEAQERGGEAAVAAMLGQAQAELVDDLEEGGGDAGDRLGGEGWQLRMRGTPGGSGGFRGCGGRGGGGRVGHGRNISMDGSCWARLIFVNFYDTKTAWTR